MELDAADSVRGPSSQLDAATSQIKATQARLLYTESTIGVAGAVAGSLILVAALWEVVPHFRLLGWLAVYVSIQGFRRLLVRAFHRASPDEGAALRWGLWFSVATTISGLAWGMAGVLLFPPNAPAHQFLLALFVAGVAAAASVVYSYSSQCYIPTLLAQLVPLAGRYLYENTEVHVIMGAAILLFGMVLIVTGRRMHLANTESLRLRFEKTDLIDSLTEQKARAEKLNEHFTAEILDRRRAEGELQKARDELEQRVIARTRELAQANVKLETATNEWEQTFDAVTDMIMILDSDYRIVRMNKAMADRLALSPEEAAGRTCYEVIHRLNCPPEFCPHTLRLADGKVHRAEILEENLGGTYDISVYPLPDSPGRPAWSVHVARDITEHKQMQEALRESEARYRVLVHNAPLGIMSFDVQGKILQVNPSLVKMLGLGSPDETGTVNLFTYPALIDSGITDNFRHSLDTGEPIVSEHPFVTKTGKEIHVRTHVVALSDAEGKTVGGQAIIEDISDRIRVEEQLRVSEDRFRNLYELSKKGEELYRSVLNSSADAIVFYDLEGRVKYLSPSFTQMFGWTMAELEGKRVPFVPETEREATLESIERLVRDGQQVKGFETKRYTKVGRALTINVSASRYNDHEGNPTGVLVILRDITERRKAEDSLKEAHERLELRVKERTAELVQANEMLKQEIAERLRVELALRESEEKYRTIIEDMVDAFYEVDLKGRFTFLNDAAPKVFQRDSHRLLGHSYREIMTEEQAQLVFRLYNRVFATGQSIRAARAKFLVGDRTERDVEFSVALISDSGGRPIGFQGICRDITELKRAEDALRESERRYRQLVETARDIIWTVGPDFRYTYVSPAVTDVLGYAVDEIIGMSPLSTLTMQSRMEVLNVFQQELSLQRESANARLRPRFAEVEQYHKDGSIRWMEFTVTALKGESDQPAGILGISRDITDRKLAAKQLERALAASRRLRAQAEEANLAKSEFLANMSHELRTPLNSVIGFSELLEDETYGELNQDQMTFVGLVLSSGRHLLELINEILDLAKVESGKMELQVSRMNVRRLLQNSLVMVREKVLRHHLELDLRIAPELHDTEIEADEFRLKQIMFNLLSNAVKFTPDYGEIRVNAETNGSFLAISVSDTGIGVRKEHFEVIFDSFEQVDSSYARQQEGTGLGLALTRRLVELHGGRIWVESEGEGKGSTFAFVIPMAAIPARMGRAAAHSIHEADDVRAIGLSDETEEEPFRPLVMAVGIDASAIDMFDRHLREAGYAVVHASDSTGAVEIASQGAPLALALDVASLQHGELDLIIELKDHPSTRSIPLAVVTLGEDSEVSLPLGELDFLVGPFDRTRLLSALRGVAKNRVGGLVNVMVVDEDPDVVDQMAATIRTGGYTVFTAHGAKQGVDLSSALNPDLIIIDIAMPHMTAFQFSRHLRDQPATKDTAILVCADRKISDEQWQRINEQLASLSTPSDGKNRLLGYLDRLRRVQQWGSRRSTA